MDWEPVIGLEVHAQLLTRSKMFCSCPADYQDSDPNTAVCPVCLAMPGVLPVINKQAVELVIRTGLALNCSIGAFAQFDRKNYSYPDLMKGYQISQYENPISYGGWMTIEGVHGARRVGITRAHLEEDVAKLQHARDGAGAGHALMDVNRAGVPLMEVVGEPDLRSPDEARLYLMKLRSILQYIGVSTADMEQGSFRCDANVSVRPRGASEYGVKVEVKNMNSFRAVHRSLEYEIQRQTELLESGGTVAQETRGWLEDQGVTVSQRSKEYANDYRYLPEPDLPPLEISRAWVDEVRTQLPELPDARRERLQRDYGLSPYDAGLLTAQRRTADYFEEALGARALSAEARPARAKALANLINSELARLLNQTGLELWESKVQAAALAELVDLVDEGAISSTQAKDALEGMFETGQGARETAAARGLSQVTDTDAIEAAVADALAGNPQAVQDYLSGKENAAKFLVGQVMKATRGRAAPGLVNELLEAQLAARKG